MTIQIEVSPEVEGLLAAEAQVRGVDVETYASDLLRHAVGSTEPRPGTLTVERFRAMLSVLASRSERLPKLATESFSRESFYEDRT